MSGEVKPEASTGPTPGRFNPLFRQAVEKVGGQKPPAWMEPIKTVTVPAGTTLVGALDAIMGKPDDSRRRKSERRLLVSWIYDDGGPRLVSESDLYRVIDVPIRLALKDGGFKYSQLVKRRYTRYWIRTGPAASGRGEVVRRRSPLGRP